MFVSCLVLEIICLCGEFADQAAQFIQARFDAEAVAVTYVMQLTGSEVK